METDKKMIKDDINFLEYPNWVIDRKNKSNTWIIQKEHGKYEIISPLGLPKHFDKTVLYFLLYKLYRESNLDKYLLKTSRYEIAKNVYYGVKDFGKNKFARIMLAIKKWSSLHIDFQGLFYEGDNYSERYFHIIDEMTLYKKTGELTIRFNEGYVKQLKETKFYKLIDFEKYKKLHKGSSARLYEILSKNFKDRNEWPINIQLLAEKLTFEKREGVKDYYPSDVLRYIKPGITEINKKTDLEINFQYNKETGICIFKKLKKQKVSFIPAIKDDDKIKKERITAKQKTEYLKKFNLLQNEEQEKILNDIKRDPFLKFLPDLDSRIYAYMSKTEIKN